MSNNLLIAISGKSGCGNTSVSRLVAEKLGIRLINFTFHNIAEEMDIPFQTLLARASRDPAFDIALDKRQKELAHEGPCVLGSRLAIWLLPDASCRVYLTGSLERRAARIAGREGKDLATVNRETTARDISDRDRFLKLYKIDNDRYEFADLVINTEEGDQFFVSDKIIGFLSEKGLVGA
jgi:cytidylate kinase